MCIIIGSTCYKCFVIIWKIRAFVLLLPVEKEKGGDIVLTESSVIIDRNVIIKV